MFGCDYILISVLKARFQVPVLKFEFFQIKWVKTTYKVAIIWQNFTQVRL